MLSLGGCQQDKHLHLAPPVHLPFLLPGVLNFANCTAIGLAVLNLVKADALNQLDGSSLKLLSYEAGTESRETMVLSQERSSLLAHSLAAAGCDICVVDAAVY